MLTPAGATRRVHPAVSAPGTNTRSPGPGHPHAPFPVERGDVPITGDLVCFTVGRGGRRVDPAIHTACGRQRREVWTTCGRRGGPGARRGRQRPGKPLSRGWRTVRLHRLSTPCGRPEVPIDPASTLG